MKDIHAGGSPVKPVVSGFLLGAALLGLAIFSPALAKAFALLGVVGAFVTNGQQAFSLLGGLT
jgi:hypothetical protein